jgi:leucyl/phenylalanyl-tRNA---protein transferase
LWRKYRILGYSCASNMNHPEPSALAWLAPGQPFPAVQAAWGEHHPAPGLLAAGGDLAVSTLREAYSQGIFPWYSASQPILWWSPDPRMVLPVTQFKLHRSLRKSLQRFLASPTCEVRIDHDFPAVIAACASSPRAGQSGTWIVAEMQEAWRALHRAGLAHSVETWIDGKLAGGLYCTAVGGAVFGESMFSRTTNTSKIALCALVALCRGQGVEWIDCQQNTTHLASLGAHEMPREKFCAHVRQAAAKKPLDWRAQSVEWKLLDDRLDHSDSQEISSLHSS